MAGSYSEHDLRVADGHIVKAASVVERQRARIDLLRAHGSSPRIIGIAETLMSLEQTLRTLCEHERESRRSLEARRIDASRSANGRNPDRETDLIEYVATWERSRRCPGSTKIFDRQ